MDTKNYQNSKIWNYAVKAYSEIIEFIKCHSPVQTAFVGNILLNGTVRPAILLRKSEKRFALLCCQEMTNLILHIAWKNPYLGEDMYEVIDSYTDANMAYKRLLFNNYIICKIGPNGESLGLTRSDFYFCFTDPDKDRDIGEILLQEIHKNNKNEISEHEE